MESSNTNKEPPPENKEKLLLGRKLHAPKYHDVVLPLHQGNPFIEALPPLRSTEEVKTLLNERLPKYDPSVRAQPWQVRKQLVDTLQQVFILLPRHYRVEEAVMDSIRNSYGYRNPLDPSGLNQQLENADQLDLESADYDEPAIGGSCIIGLGGTGKTRTVKRTLVRGCPQVILHDVYEKTKTKIGRSQICWIYTPCAHDAGVKDLCESVGNIMDRLLGTNYARFIRGGKKENGMMKRLARVMAIHAVGLLVIDEVQNICVGRPIERKRLSRFLVGLQERISTRVMLVGTPEARAEIIQDLPLLRRTMGENGQIEWEQLMPGKEWDDFMNGIWVYQYTRSETKLTHSLKKKFWELSLGIPDVAVRLYRMAQREIIGHKGSEDEVIDDALLELIAKTRMGFAHKLLESMRKNPENAKAWDDPKNQQQREEESLRNDKSPPEPTPPRASVAPPEKPTPPTAPVAAKAPESSLARPIIDLRTLIPAR